MQDNGTKRRMNLFQFAHNYLIFDLQMVYLFALAKLFSSNYRLV